MMDPSIKNGSFSTLFALPLLLFACACGAKTYYIAEGASVSLPGWLQCKDISSTDPKVVAIKNGYLRPNKQGTSSIRGCDEPIEVVVRKPAQLEINDLGASLSDTAYLDLQVKDQDGRDLLIGNSSLIEWILPDGVRRGATCNHMTGYCRPAWQLKVTGPPGNHIIQARYGTLTATRTLTFR